MSTPTVSNDFTSAVFTYLDHLGIEEQQVLNKLGFKTVSQMQIKGRVPLYYYEKLYEVAEQLTGDCHIGLHVGSTPLPKTWGLVSYLAMTAPNTLIAFKAFMQYSMLQLNFGHFLLEEVDDKFISVTWKLNTPRNPNRHVIEHLYANIYYLAEAQVGFPRSHSVISFRHSAEGDPTHIEEVLLAEVHFDQPEYRTLFSRDVLSKDSLQPQETLHHVAIELAKEQLMELRNDDRLINMVHAIIMERLPYGLPKLNDVAKTLDMAPRTLQRRFQQRNIKYQELLDNVRSELAQDLIQVPDLVLNDIAQYLGFNDQSAFQSAFKRWYGVTPGKYRQNL